MQLSSLINAAEIVGLPIVGDYRRLDLAGQGQQNLCSDDNRA